MPWQETSRMLERRQFIETWLRTGDVSGLSRSFGISRKTAYKWLGRFLEGGREQLVDRSRRPHHSPQETSPAVQQAVVDLRRAHPTWGPKKLLAKLSQTKPSLALPAVSTAGDILRRAGLVESRRRRRRLPEVGGAWPRAEQANDIWCVDYKGEFKMGNGRYCYPLTVSDEHSRFLLLCRGFERIAGSDVEESFTRLFRLHGLPEAIRSDNGSPFASTGLCRLSRVSVWWLRLGIALKRNLPAHPQHNGRHERIHRDLKAQTTRPPADDLPRQQHCFDRFTYEHNHERPHEALGQEYPVRHYHPSPRPFPERLPDLEYPSHYEVRRVGSNGCIELWGKTIYISHALIGQDVGLVEVDDGHWAIQLGNLRIGTIDQRTARVEDATQAG